MIILHRLCCRDGSAIELVALCYSTVTWLSDLKKAGRYPYNGVKWSVNAASGKPRLLDRRILYYSFFSTGTQEKNLSFSDWSQLIKTNFEPRFYVAEDSSGDFIRRDLVHVTPMYKDTYGSFHFWADYQLRPNQCIALVVVSDDLFKALKQSGQNHLFRLPIFSIRSMPGECWILSRSVF